MTYKLVRVDPHQAGVVAGIIYAILGVLFLPFLLLGTLASNQSPIGPGFAFAVPILYGVAGYIGTLLGCFLFNQVARRMGGITFSFTD